MTDKKEENVLSIRGMSKSFGRNRVLDHINLDVKRGTVMGLMGENGAGKTTLMRVLYGMYTHHEGTMLINGEKVAFSSPKDAIAKGIGMVHQHFSLVPSMTVAENVVIGRPPYKKGSRSSPSSARSMDWKSIRRCV